MRLIKDDALDKTYEEGEAPDYENESPEDKARRERAEAKLAALNLSHDELPAHLRARYDDTFVPKRLERAIQVHRKMMELAQPYTDSSQDGRYSNLIAYIGSIQTVLDTLRIPATYYGDIVGILKATNAVYCVRRGNRDKESIWLVYEEPTLETYKLKRAEEPNHTVSGQVKTHTQQIRDLTMTVRELMHNIDVLNQKLDKLLDPDTTSIERAEVMQAHRLLKSNPDLRAQITATALERMVQDRETS